MRIREYKSQGRGYAASKTADFWLPSKPDIRLRPYRDESFRATF